MADSNKTPQTLAEYLPAAAGQPLADKLTAAFGDGEEGKNIKGVLAIYLYADDTKSKDLHNTGTFDPDALKLKHAAVLEPGIVTLPNGREEMATWKDSVLGHDLNRVFFEKQKPAEIETFLTQVKENLGPDASAAATNYFNARADFVNASTQDDKDNAVRATHASLNGFVTAIKASVDSAHLKAIVDKSYEPGAIGNPEDDFGKMFGPRARVDMEIHSYAATRAAQNAGTKLDDHAAFDNMEAAAKAKGGYDHAVFTKMLLKPENADKLITSVDLIAKSEPEAFGDMKPQAIINIKQTAEDIKTAQQQVNREAFSQAVQNLSQQQISALWEGAAYNQTIQNGNPDEQRALQKLGFDRPASEPAQPEAPAATPPVPPAVHKEVPPQFNFNVAPPASEEGPVHKTSAPAGLKPFDALDLRGLHITGGETPTGTPQAPAPVISPSKRQPETVQL